MLLEGNRIRLWHGPKENRHRPAVDSLFNSAAKEFSPRCIGVVLTGSLDCGTLGLMTVRAQGGVTIVQDPAEAEQPDMPESAMRSVPIDYCVPLAKMPHLLEPLFTTTESTGNGLGLAVCKQIIEDLRGTIQIESSVGQGTTVRLALPTA